MVLSCVVTLVGQTTACIRRTVASPLAAPSGTTARLDLHWWANQHLLVKGTASGIMIDRPVCVSLKYKLFTESTVLRG